MGIFIIHRFSLPSLPYDQYCDQETASKLALGCARSWPVRSTRQHGAAACGWWQPGTWRGGRTQPIHTVPPAPHPFLLLRFATGTARRRRRCPQPQQISPVPPISPDHVSETIGLQQASMEQHSNTNTQLQHEDDAAVPSLEQLKHDALLTADDSLCQPQQALASCVFVDCDPVAQKTSAESVDPTSASALLRLAVTAAAPAAAPAAVPFLTLAATAAVPPCTMSYTLEDDKYRSLLSAQHRLAHSPALSESDDELDYSSSASEQRAGRSSSGSSSAASSSASSSSSASPPTTSSSPQLPSHSPVHSYSPPKFAVQPVALRDLELVVEDPPKQSGVQLVALELVEGQQQGFMVVPSQDAANMAAANPLDVAPSAGVGAVGNEVIPRISLEQERAEQEKQDHEYALALQAVLQSQSGLAAAAPARVPAAASPTGRRYPAPRADGEYEEKEDWRVRYARDIQMGAKIGARSSWEARVHEVAARIERGQESSLSSDSSSDSDLYSEVDTPRITPKRAPMPAVSVVPVAPALLPSGVARSLSEQSAAARAQALRAQSNAQIGRKQKSRGWRGPLKGEVEEDYVPAPPVMVTCGICQEEVAQYNTQVFGRQLGADGQVIHARSSGVQCKHEFCVDCLKAYLQHEINDGKVLKLRCPGRTASNEPCGCIAPSGWVSSMVGRELYAKYERFLKLKADDSFRSCPNPRCMHVQQKSSLLAGDNMVCEKCQTAYCFLHDLAHVGSSCSAYQRKLAAESKDSLAHIKAHTIKCPWPLCRTACEKSSGCNHMTCSRCNSEFCYLCGGFYFGGLHFASFNLLGCPGMKGDHGEAGSRNTFLRMAARWLLGFPLMVALALLAFALFIAVEGIYLGWLFGLSPIWIAWGIGLCVNKRRQSGKPRLGYHERKWERRFLACIGWGIYLIGGLC